MKLAAALLITACSAAPPPAPLPKPAPIARPAPDAAPAPITPAAQACLPDAGATDVSLLEGDAHTIDVCFAPSACFAIDRRTSSIAATTMPSIHRTLLVPHHAQPITVDKTSADSVNVCNRQRCMSIARSERAVLDGGRADVDDAFRHMVVTVGGGGTTARFFRIDFDRGDVTSLPISSGAPCAEAIWLDDDILVSSDDCNGGGGRGVLYDRNGKRIAQVGLDIALDTQDVTWLRRDNAFAILAPRAYSLVLADELGEQQSVIDLVPIQAQATPTPHFQLAPLDEHDWLVASSTGGVGIVDHTTATLTKTWIIPRCEAAPATGP